MFNSNGHRMMRDYLLDLGMLWADNGVPRSIFNLERLLPSSLGEYFYEGPYLEF